MIRLPAVRGIIDRRILANYRLDPGRTAAALPAPFRPQLVGGHAVGGICLIRLTRVRPKALPLPWGIRSENAAHRIAVEWEDGGVTRTGVYIPRRDTDSRLNALAGGRVFPGVHHHARFEVAETTDRFSVTMTADDGGAAVHVAGRVTGEFPAGSVFGDLEAASAFFRDGSLGYSDAAEAGRFDGLELRVSDWRAEPLAVEAVRSDFFEDPARFPPGTATFDCALLMRGIDHEWHGRADLCCAAGGRAAGRAAAAG